MKEKLVAIVVLFLLSVALQAYSYSLDKVVAVESVITPSSETFESVSQVKFDKLSIDSEETFEKMSK